MKGGGGKYDIVRGVGSEYASGAITTSLGHDLSMSCQLPEPGKSRSKPQPLAAQESCSSPCSVPSTLCHWVNWLCLNRAVGKVDPDLSDSSSPLRRPVWLPMIRLWQGHIRSLCYLQILEALGADNTGGVRKKMRMPFLRFKAWLLNAD